MSSQKLDPSHPAFSGSIVYLRSVGDTPDVPKRGELIQKVVRRCKAPHAPHEVTTYLVLDRTPPCHIEVVGPQGVPFWIVFKPIMVVFEGPVDDMRSITWIPVSGHSVGP